MSDRTAAHSVELTGDKAPEWVHLLPMGRFQGRDGRGPYQLRDQAHAQAVIAATRAYQAGADLPVDYDHQIMYAQKNGQPAIASGWVKELEARQDGVWGRVEWTAAASQHIEAKEYRYLSPVFSHAPDGTVLRLQCVGLVNNPNLQLTAIASQGDHMEELLKRLRALFGLADTATEADVVAHAQQLADGGKTLARILGLSETTAPAQITTAAHAAFTKLATTLKLPAASTAEQIAVAAQQAVTTTGTPDMSQFVPMSAFLSLQAEMSSLTAKLAKDEAETAINAAMTAGKLSPALKDWAVKYAGQDLEGFKAWVDGAPVIVAPGASAAHAASGGPPPASNGDGLTAEETAICSQLGITAEEFKKNKEGE